MSRSWLDKFIDQKLVKIAKDVQGNYIEQLARIFEGKLSTKFSSIDEALQDFASRLGLVPEELETLKKQAFIKIAENKKTQQTLQKLKNDGITDPKAIRFMSKSKTKHTSETSSPYALNQQQGEQLAEVLEEQKSKLTTTDDQNQLNEMSKFSNTRRADFPSKVFPFDQPSIEQIVKELQERKPEKEFTTARTAFKFRNIERIGGKSSFPEVPKSPIAVTIFSYAVIKDKVKDFLSKDLLKLLATELDFDQWSEKIAKLALDSDRPRLEARLDEVKNLLQSEQADFLGKGKGKGVDFIKLLPISYQDEVIRILASGRYKHLIREKGGKSVFSSSYEKSTFVLMKSFGPYKKINIIEKNKELLNKFLRSIISEQHIQQLKEGQEIVINLEYDQARKFLDDAGAKYKEVPTTEDDPSTISVKDGKIKVNIASKPNDDYQPLTLEKSIQDPQQQEEMAFQLSEAIYEASRANLPLAFEAQEDKGTTFFEGRSLNDLATRRMDFLDPIMKKDEKLFPNPNAGLHPTYKGEIPKKRTPPPGLKMSSKLVATLKKYAEYFEIWLDDQGRFFSNEDQLRNTLVTEMLDQQQQTIIDEVVKNVLSMIGPALSKFPTKSPQKPSEQPPLLANSKIKLTKVALRSENQDLIKILLRGHND